MQVTVQTTTAIIATPVVVQPRSNLGATGGRPPVQMQRRRAALKDPFG